MPVFFRNLSLTKPLVVYPPIKIVLSPFNFNISAAEPFKKAKLSVDVPANVYVLAALSAVKLAFPKLFEAGNAEKAEAINNGGGKEMSNAARKYPRFVNEWVNSWSYKKIFHMLVLS